MAEADHTPNNERDATLHVFCVECGTCLKCDPEDGCYDYRLKITLPASHHVWPKDEDADGR